MPDAKAFVVVQVAIHDREGYRRYESAAHQEIFDRFGGTLVGLDEDADLLEGDWPWTRTVLIEFPSKDVARAWYASDEYQSVVGWRHESATSNLAVISGYPG